MGPVNLVTPQQILASRLVVVDDDPCNLEIVLEILGLCGFQNITAFSCPLTAMQKFVEDEEPFDLLLLDLKMPRMDGFEFLANLCLIQNNQETLPLPVLVLTADGDTPSRLRAFSLGARDFISKPFMGHELEARIRNQLIAHLAQKRLALENDLLETAVCARTTELRNAQLDVIHRLGRAAEYRDNEIGMHVVRMAHSTRLLALANGQSAAEVEKLFQAAPMHDLGKIGIPDAILLKPGRLDEAERRIMDTHAAIGAEILSHSDSPLLGLAAEIALTHHEKWDGSGYPRRLAGEDIPLSGRLVALADVFDALTSERPYKKAWPVEEALALLREQSGRHFDPRLVDLFFGILPNVLLVREQFKEGHQETP